MVTNKLGTQLRAIRDLQQKSLNAVAKPAGISAAYLQKLEQGEVQTPSPHILHRLAEVLNVSYQDLMQLAGYIVPRSSEESITEKPANILAHALSSENLTDDEQEAVARYLAWYRHEKATTKKPSQTP